MLQESWFVHPRKRENPLFAQPVQCQMRLSPMEPGQAANTPCGLLLAQWPWALSFGIPFNQIIAELEAIWLPPIFARSKKNENNTRSMEVSIPIQWKCPFH